MAWTATGEAARIARRFLCRFPNADLPNPDRDLLTTDAGRTRHSLGCRHHLLRRLSNRRIGL